MTDLEARARAAQQRAYAPYSRFKVGAAVQMDGQVFDGVNVESASYPLCVCAERNAIAAAINGGARVLQRVVVCTDASPPSSPCGGCRQWLHEFRVDRVAFRREDGSIAEYTPAELLPDTWNLPD